MKTKRVKKFDWKSLSNNTTTGSAAPVTKKTVDGWAKDSRRRLKNAHPMVKQGFEGILNWWYSNLKSPITPSRKK